MNLNHYCSVKQQLFRFCAQAPDESGQAALAFPFLSTAKKGNKKCRRLKKISKNQNVFLKSGNSLRSNSPDFLTENNLIFLTRFS